MAKDTAEDVKNASSEGESQHQNQNSQHETGEPSASTDKH